MINKKKELLEKFPIEKNTKIINNEIIFIKTANIYLLKSIWEIKDMKGESFVFLTDDIKHLDEKKLMEMIEPYVLKDIKKESIDKYSFKKLEEYTFFYYTVLY
jgi:hypothetical protein